MATSRDFAINTADCNSTQKLLLTLEKRLAKGCWLANRKRERPPKSIQYATVLDNYCELEIPNWVLENFEALERDKMDKTAKVMLNGLGVNRIVRIKIGANPAEAKDEAWLA